MKPKGILLSLLALLGATAALSAAHHGDGGQHGEANVETYKIDPAHSSVKFAIRHFVAKTTGSFEDFEGTLTLNRDDLTKSKVRATVRIPSVDTDNTKRDNHLQEDDYFDAPNHPLMVFESTGWEKTGERTYAVTGDLRIRGITREVTLDAELFGFGKGRGEDYLTGWEATTTLDRTEWGVDGGQPAVGTDVEVTINIEAIRQ